MKSLVVYDSNFGNTKLVAEAVARELGAESRAVKVTEFKAEDLAGVELLVVGSPINGWRPTQKTMDMLNALAPDKLKGIKAASFDTRVRMFMHGDATNKIAKMLKVAGAELVAEPRGFIVVGKEGPLATGELEKVKDWIKA